MYETLATRPPSIAASIGFVFLHGASFVVALVLLVILAIPQSTDLMNIVAASANNPRYSIEPDTIITYAAELDFIAKQRANLHPRPAP